ncbi:hypothetical protein BC936DRAFT_146409 [Jimgerdemannia flammicorona]|uniref:Uncharacterized protein n=1 Tax=Jimgerdemannia flammicorona TaxID=994334 RepID=A0A433D7Q6_9FUNG|nr:hypothetical protein BC936DRAFT_146409 [Jimgerdemannia flammicorona]
MQSHAQATPCSLLVHSAQTPLVPPSFYYAFSCRVTVPMHAGLITAYPSSGPPHDAMLRT